MRAGSAFHQLMYRNRRRLLLFLAMLIVVQSPFLLAAVKALSIGLWTEDLLFLYILGGIAGILTLLLMIPPVLIVRFAPNWRGNIEGFAWSIPFALIFIRVVDTFGQGTIFDQYPLPSVFVSFYVLHFVLGQLSWFKRFTSRSTGTYASLRSTAQLWDMHCPAPTSKHLEHNVLTESVTIDPDNSMIRSVVYDYGMYKTHHTLAFLTLDAPQCYAYDMIAHGQSRRSSHFVLRIHDNETHRQIDTSLTQFNLSIFAWLHNWCDDLMGQDADFEEARESGAETFSLIKTMHDQAAKAKLASRPIAAMPA